jgi:V/A-type H+-transporting ATPase subunit A
MLKMVLHFYNEGSRALKNGVYLKDILALEVRDRIARAKYLEEKDIEKINDINAEMTSAVEELMQEGGLLNA